MDPQASNIRSLHHAGTVKARGKGFASLVYLLEVFVFPGNVAE